MFAQWQLLTITTMPTDGYDVDEQIYLQKLVLGDKQAFTVLYRKYSPQLYTSFLRLVKCEDTAKEILQDAFLKLWELRATIRPEKSFRAFLYKVAENLVYDYFRKVARDKRLENHLIAVATTHYHHPDELLVFNESQRLIQQAIDHLPPTRKKIFTLCKIEGKSYDEIAGLLSISTSTISDHMVKANRFLKSYLHQHADITIAFVAWFLLTAAYYKSELPLS